MLDFLASASEHTVSLTHPIWAYVTYGGVCLEGVRPWKALEAFSYTERKSRD